MMPHLFALGLLGLNWICKILPTPFQAMAFMAALSYQLFIPLLKDFFVSFKPLSGRPLYEFLGFSVLSLFLYGFFYKTFHGQVGAFVFIKTYPSDLLFFIFQQLLFVSIPEEYFYRGFLQNYFLKKHAFWMGIFWVNFYFALSHFVGEWDFIRLLPFFPGILFSLLAYRYKTLFAPIIYHVLSNLFSYLIYPTML